MKKFIIAAAFVALSLTGGATFAEEKQDLSPAQQAEARQILDTAKALVAYGEAKNDALALVTAAKMVASVPGRVLAEGQDGSAGADKSKSFDVEAVLKKAEDLAQGDELITKVAGQVRETAAANAKYVCYWAEQCYWNGYCEWAYACW
jgi:hypothetical protein